MVAAVASVAAGLLISVAARAGTAGPSSGWLCVAETASGFVYNKNRREWVPTTLAVDKQYVVRKPDSDELFILRMVYGIEWIPSVYVVVEIGTNHPLACRNLDSKIDRIQCNGRFAQFTINPQSLRMEMISNYGYLPQYRDFNRARTDEPDTPIIENGRCSPL
jgi:hypothetical protein